jgi:hypothetical protein
METFYGMIKNNNEMAVGGEATRFTLTGRNNVTIEIEGDNSVFQNNLEQWVNATGDWQRVGVENVRNVFFVSNVQRV